MFRRQVVARSMASALTRGCGLRGFASTTKSSPSGAVKLIDDGVFATLLLDNPKKHNCMSDVVINELRNAVKDVEELAPRALFVRANGKSFSAGADLEWMKRAAGYTRDENVRDAMELSGMLYDLATLPVPTVALVQGAALGGGVGIVSVCDVAVGVASSKFTLSEVKLGLLPATISPYVVRRIGAQHSRRYFLTAERFDAEEAKRIGLLHEVVQDDQGLDDFEDKLKSHFAVNAPGAMRVSKKVIELVEGEEINEQLRRETAHELAKQRETDECKEGIAAFFEKRTPSFHAKL